MSIEAMVTLFWNYVFGSLHSRIICNTARSMHRHLTPKNHRPTIQWMKANEQKERVFSGWNINIASPSPAILVWIHVRWLYFWNEYDFQTCWCWCWVDGVAWHGSCNLPSADVWICLFVLIIININRQLLVLYMNERKMNQVDLLRFYLSINFHLFISAIMVLEWQ